ncbi:unnamed protein product [Camellia sinensis]|uniref:probable ADP-ribosylation factor GTPase-activating protein AGD14 isoform X1 n=2 Tax=Camellia sinensis TaxID=4442 RepID=UPI00103625E7|nr:probable ADP-ribosylation factor GTPase-activating protein AGD14 isoform X1 [Camellia sinensis]XP_028112888.1 probable ADP-ribosylation factor GTPase-activating protein AGD14 isoform X1 [Camellia sinensis]
MPIRVKEEERIERIIRNLLKLPENRRCINCNSLGPQYVCTTFWTFVCTNCSGVHREFSHRVKSVSMAKFNTEEVNALQAGGNERAREIYFKEWDPQRHSFPDCSNQNRLRDFIKHVYVDRKFTGGRSMGKLAMVKTDTKEDSCDWHSGERPSSGQRSDDRSSKYYIDERRSPGYKLDNVRSSTHRNRPVNFEIVDDRFRDDGYGSGKRSETHRPSNAESRARGKSPVYQKSRNVISPPVVRPVRDILGDNVPNLRVGESPEANDRMDNESSTHGTKTESSNDPGSVDRKSQEHKRVNSGSLIDFSADLEPADPAAVPQTQQTALSIDGGNGASVQSSTKANASDASNANSLESIFFELSAPPAGPVDIMSAAPGNAVAPSATPVALSSTPTAFNTGDASASSPFGMAPMPPSSSSDSMARATDDSPNIQQTSPSVGAFYNQTWTSSLTPNAQDSSSAAAGDSSQPSSKVVQDTTSGLGSQTLLVETKSRGRQELPSDLFTASHSSFPAPVPSWQVHPPYGMGYGMQYHPTAMSTPAFPNSAKSRNPFDLNDDNTQAQGPMLPSMLPVQGALPNSSAPTALLYTADTHSSHLMQPQASSYGSIPPSQIPSSGMSPSPGAFMGQQFPNNMPFPRPQKVDTVSRGNDAFASLNPIQQPISRYSAPTSTPNSASSSSGGNPFA